MGMVKGRGRQDVSSSELIHSRFAISRLARAVKLSPSESRGDDIGDGQLALGIQRYKGTYFKVSGRPSG